MSKPLGEKEAQLRWLKEQRHAMMTSPPKFVKATGPTILKPAPHQIEKLRQLEAATKAAKPKETTVKKEPKSTAPKRTAAQASANLKKAKAAKKAKGGTKTAPKAAKRTSGPDSKPAAGPKEVRPGSKLAIVVDLLKRPEGCTTAEILKATEWPSVSVPQQARMAGLELRKEKNAEGVTVYRA